MKCIIIEDQLPAQRILKRYIGDVPELTLLRAFTDPLAALAFMKEESIDLIFLDIHLPKISGMDFLKIMPYSCKVILTTAFSEYALEGYEFDVVDYLLKPIPFNRFLKAVSKIIYQTEPTTENPSPSLASSPNDFIFVKSDKTILKLDFETIVYIKSEDNFTRVISQHKNYFLSYTLKYWEDVLPTAAFCRIHKSYLVHFKYIEKIEGNQVTTPKGVLPIGRSYKDNFMKHIALL